MGFPLPVSYVLALGEPLLETHEKMIKSVSGANIFRDYSASECMRMGFESVNNKGTYLLDIYNYYFNFVRNGETNDIIVTNLNNQIFPFIRYKIGDQGKIISPSIKEPIDFPILDLDGRVFDIIKTPKGKHLTVHFFTFTFEYLHEYISNFHVRQTSISELTIEIIERKHLDKDKESKLIKNIEEYTENSMKVKLVKVDFIKANKGGKRHLLKSLEKYG